MQDPFQLLNANSPISFQFNNKGLEARVSRRRCATDDPSSELHHPNYIIYTRQEGVKHLG